MMDVFMSIGRTFTPEQEEFVAAVEQTVRDNQLTGRCLGRTEYSSEQPLKAIERLMTECSGTVIVAFERLYIESGIERRGSNEEKPIDGMSLPTVWNQIEAAMAYVMKQPLLVIVEDDLRSEGLLETGYDWYVQWVSLDRMILNDREFKGIFADWKRRVEEYHQNRDQVASGTAQVIDPEKLTIGQIVGSLKPQQLWAMGIAVAAAVPGLAYLACTLWG